MVVVDGDGGWFRGSGDKFKGLRFEGRLGVRWLWGTVRDDIGRGRGGGCGVQ